MLPLETVARIAELAQLGLENDEMKKMQKELSQVLEFFQELERYQAEPLLPPENERAVNSARTDQSEAAPENTRAAIVKNFPAAKDDLLKVRSVF